MGSGIVLSSEDRYLLAGLSWKAEWALNETHPVQEKLRRSGIDSALGDHAGRLTQLWCLKSDSMRARKILQRLPEDERKLVILFAES